MLARRMLAAATTVVAGAIFLAGPAHAADARGDHIANSVGDKFDGGIFGDKFDGGIFQEGIFGDNFLRKARGRTDRDRSDFDSVFDGFDLGR